MLQRKASLKGRSAAANGGTVIGRERKANERMICRRDKINKKYSVMVELVDCMHNDCSWEGWVCSRVDMEEWRSH